MPSDNATDVLPWGERMTQQEFADVIISRDPVSGVRESSDPQELPAETVILDVHQPPDTGELMELQAPESVPAPAVVGLAPEGHICLVLPPGEVVSGSMAAVAAAEVERLSDNRKLPMLLVLTGVEAVTKGARTIFNGTHSLEAVAVLGVSPVDRVIANFLLGGTTQPCPTRYFSVEQDALAWLKRKRSVA